ncbi:MAG: phosphatidylserine decarboxylase [Gammaproteobacteria bacterium SG8_30]|nr:MAG: phosphatidylserine decarboxylase [Gammaproteobacteria bacterium SG8_30]
MTPDSRSLSGRLFVGAQHLLPQHLLSRGMHALARSRWSPLKNLFIRSFLRFYAVNLAEAEHSDPTAYESFNAFFTRALKPGARVIDRAAEALVSPVDAVVSQAGRIERDMLLQAKGIHYAAAALLGGDAARARPFEGGHFATLYLAPYDYHRIHMPLAGTLTSVTFIPGDLFSVNAVTAAGVPGLFARNERIACLFDTAVGPVAIVLVGALFVGSMSLAWLGEVEVDGSKAPRELPLGEALPAFDKAAELGRFNMGSTVIVMLPPDAVEWSSGLTPGSAVRLGERIGTLRR